MYKLHQRIFFSALFILSCGQPKKAETATEFPHTIATDSISVSEAQSDSLIYDKYSGQYEQVSYASLEDSFLIKALEKYFVFEEEGIFPDYTCKNETGSSSQSEHASDYKMTITWSPFDSVKHPMTRAKEGFVCLINNKVFWGTDGDIPVSQISSVNATYKGVAISIPPSEYDDLYSPFEDDCTPDKLHLTDGKNSYIVFVSSCSDGAGSYTVAWIFKNGKYIRRVVDSSC